MKNNNKNKQFAVIGLGRFGTSVATTLFKLGYDVLAIDVNEEQVQKISETVTHVVQADTTDENSLKALGIRNYDVVIVAVGSDIQANVLTTLLLKELGIKYIVAKAINELHGKMLAKIGADRVVYPERDMGLRVAHSLVSTNVLEYIELSPDLSVAEITAPKILVGHSLAETNLRVKYELNVVAIKRNEVLLVPPPSDEKIKAGDILILVGQTKGIQKLEELE
ncbi:Ktr system potassium uptake protein A [Sporomusa ovata DSM 2662]|uniref:Trk system potassium uptake protein TrkA n=1 Tax=Sporomusa ovata TaxID=2378 RepID=A0A0U1L2Q3_9FIRM|nr:NAD-binding protein [Sporomusa ovata]EQB25412.1 Ktr system potassium uptake protein C [Sporomusa ovata DSM 2662]CQR73977.1 Trk system potassium uptake protein TrkA [Sporomusa ovata]